MFNAKQQKIGSSQKSINDVKKKTVAAEKKIFDQQEQMLGKELDKEQKKQTAAEELVSRNQIIVEACKRRIISLYDSLRRHEEQQDAFQAQPVPSA